MPPAKNDDFDEDKCRYCLVECKNQQQKQLHNTLPLHNKRKNISAFLNKISTNETEHTRPSEIARRYAYLKENVLGADCIVEFVFDWAESGWWACSICYESGNNYDQLDQHLNSRRHLGIYLNEFLGDAQKNFLTASVSEILEQKDKVFAEGETILPPDVIKLRMDKPEASANLILVADRAPQYTVTRTAFPTMFFLNCPTCNDAIIFRGKETEAAEAWRRHTVGPGHRNALWINNIIGLCAPEDVVDETANSREHNTVSGWKNYDLLLSGQLPVDAQMQGPVCGMNYLVQFEGNSYCSLCSCLVDGLEDHFSCESHILRFLTKLDPKNGLTMSFCDARMRRARLLQCLPKKALYNDKARRCPCAMPKELKERVIMGPLPLPEPIPAPEPYDESRNCIMCSTCLTTLPLVENDHMSAWHDHIESELHYTMIAKRAEYFLDDQFSVPVQSNLEPALANCVQKPWVDWKQSGCNWVHGQANIGLEYFIEDRDSETYICILCAEAFHYSLKQEAIDHIRGLDHLKKYCHVNANLRCMIPPIEACLKHEDLLKLCGEVIQRMPLDGQSNDARVYDSALAARIGTWGTVKRRSFEAANFDTPLRESYEILTELVDIVAEDTTEAPETIPLRNAMLATGLVIIDMEEKGDLNPELLVRCTKCHVVFVCTPENLVEAAWDGHFAREEHFQRQAALAACQMAPAGFAKTYSQYTVKPFEQKNPTKKVGWQVNKNTKSHEYVLSIVGLEDIVDRKSDELNNADWHPDFYCRICFTSFRRKSQPLEEHVRSWDHVMYYVHKYHPKAMKRVQELADEGKNAEIRKHIAQLLRDTVPPSDYCIRVYDPVGEKERKALLAMKQLHMEEKRKVLEEERRIAEEKRRKKDEERIKARQEALQKEAKEKEEKARKEKRLREEEAAKAAKDAKEAELRRMLEQRQKELASQREKLAQEKEKMLKSQKEKDEKARAAKEKEREREREKERAREKELERERERARDIERELMREKERAKEKERAEVEAQKNRINDMQLNQQRLLLQLETLRRQKEGIPVVPEPDPVIMNPLVDLSVPPPSITQPPPMIHPELVQYPGVQQPMLHLQPGMALPMGVIPGLQYPMGVSMALPAAPHIPPPMNQVQVPVAPTPIWNPTPPDKPSLARARVDPFLLDPGSFANRDALLKFMWEQGTVPIPQEELPKRFNNFATSAEGHIGLDAVIEVICLDDPVLESYYCSMCRFWAFPSQMQKHLGDQKHRLEFLAKYRKSFYQAIMKEKNHEIQDCMIEQFAVQLWTREKPLPVVTQRFRTVLNRIVISRMWPSYVTELDRSWRYESSAGSPIPVAPEDKLYISSQGGAMPVTDVSSALWSGRPVEQEPEGPAVTEEVVAPSRSPPFFIISKISVENVPARKLKSRRSEPHHVTAAVLHHAIDGNKKRSKSREKLLPDDRPMTWEESSAAFLTKMGVKVATKPSSKEAIPGVMSVPIEGTTKPKAPQTPLDPNQETSKILGLLATMQMEYNRGGVMDEHAINKLYDEIGLPRDNAETLGLLTQFSSRIFGNGAGDSSSRDQAKIDLAAFGINLKKPDTSATRSNEMPPPFGQNQRDQYDSGPGMQQPFSSSTSSAAPSTDLLPDKIRNLMAGLKAGTLDSLFPKKISGNDQSQPSDIYGLPTVSSSYPNYQPSQPFDYPSTQQQSRQPPLPKTNLAMPMHPSEMKRRSGDGPVFPVQGGNGVKSTLPTTRPTNGDVQRPQQDDPQYPPGAYNEPPPVPGKESATKTARKKMRRELREHGYDPDAFYYYADGPTPIPGRNIELPKGQVTKPGGQAANQDHPPDVVTLDDDWDSAVGSLNSMIGGGPVAQGTSRRGRGAAHLPRQQQQQQQRQPQPGPSSNYAHYQQQNQYKDHQQPYEPQQQQGQPSYFNQDYGYDNAWQAPPESIDPWAEQQHQQVAPTGGRPIKSILDIETRPPPPPPAAPLQRYPPARQQRGPPAYNRGGYGHY
ncbi:unnamed protein product, partial [Mesorhabditis spiculigera]